MRKPAEHEEDVDAEEAAGDRLDGGGREDAHRPGVVPEDEADRHATQPVELDSTPER
jgi:hypothetical protein